MGSTCALLGPISGELSREAVERLLAGDPSIDPIEASDWSSTFGLLDGRRTPFDVLIADFSTEGAPAIEDLLREYPYLSVAAINLSGFDTHFRNIDSRLFVTFISALGLGETAARQPDGKPARAVWSTGVVTRLPLSRSDASYRSHSEQMADLCSWLDAVLSRVLARAVGLGDARDIAGLTMDVGTARSLLGEDNARRDAEALGWEIRSIEADLLGRSREEAEARLPLRRIEQAFGLDPLERRILWLTLAPEIDERYARVIGVINDDLGRRRPTPALIAAAFDCVGGAWELLGRFTGSRPFARLALVAPDPSEPHMPWPQKSLACPQDIVDTVLTGGAAPPSLTRIAA